MWYKENNNEKKSITIPELLFKQMIDHVKFNLPYETCGILSGREVRVEKLWRLKSEKKSQYSYQVSKEKVSSVLEEIERLGESILAIYHSHPTTRAIPSTKDIIYHPDPNVLMIIISFASLTSDVRCYKIVNNQYDEWIVKITHPDT